MSSEKSSSVDNNTSKSVLSQSEPTASSAVASSACGVDKKKKSAEAGTKGKNKCPSGEVQSKGTKSSAGRASKGKPSKSQEKHGSKKSVITVKSKDKVKQKNKSSERCSKSKHKSSEGHRSKPKSSDGHRHGSKRKSKKKKHSKEGSQKMKTASARDIPKATRKKMASSVRKIGECKGAIAVSSDKAIQSVGYTVESSKLYHSDYSQVLRAKKNGQGGFVAKVVNLTECSPRSRTNLLQNSLPILRFVSGVNEKQKEPLSSFFIAVSDIFLVSGAKLIIFMAECKTSHSLYDLVKSGKTLPPVDIRKWFRDMVAGVDALQQLGCAHRNVKLQHVLFDNGNAKLCGWSKAVFTFEPHKKRILLQRKERRVRRNYHLPPEAFLGSYEPSKADIWSLGVALVAMSTGRYPFNVRDKKTKFSAQWRQFVKHHELNTLARNLCHKTFIIDPKKRISSSSLLAEKYFAAATNKLAMRSCKADPTDVEEDSRVGAMSNVDLGAKSTKDEAKLPSEAPNAGEGEAAAEEAPVEEEQNWAEEAKADKSGVEENATGYEGGNVGVEEALPEGEQEDESQMAEKNAPEEAEAEAQPEEGAEAEEGGEAGEAAEGTEEEAEAPEEEAEE